MEIKTRLREPKTERWNPGYVHENVELLPKGTWVCTSCHKGATKKSRLRKFPCK